MSVLTPEGLELFEDPVKFRGLRALHPYAHLSPITLSHPLLLVTRHDASQWCCQSCFQLGSAESPMPVICPGCSHARYCSEACLRDHSVALGGHDAEECGLWAGEVAMPHYSLVQVHRAARRIEGGDAALKAATDALVSYEDSEDGHGWDGESEDGLHRWLLLLSKGNPAQYPAYRRLYFALKLNGFNVKPAAGQPGRAFASGLYPHLALFNHSCEPNCGIVYPPAAAMAIKLVALRPIGVGEELTIGYVDPYAPGRREALRKNFFFSCACTLCASGDSALLAQHDTVIQANEMLHSAMAARAAGALDAPSVRLLIHTLVNRETGRLRLARTSSPDALWQWLLFLVDAAKGAEYGEAEVISRMAEYGFEVMRRLYGDEECPPPAIMPYLSFFIAAIQ